MTIQSNITTEDPITTSQVRKVQLKNEVSDRHLWGPGSDNLLSRVDTNVCIRRPDCSNGDRSTKVGQGFDGLPVPRYNVTEGPGGVGDEEDDCRLVQAVSHVQPELRLRVFETTNSPDVQLREC